MIALMLAAAVSLTPPSDFDPEVGLRGTDKADGSRLHKSHGTTGFARNLLENGTPEDIALAVKILDAMTGAQETRREERNYGNYRWYVEDEKVTDRNGAAFVLSGLIPLVIEYGDRLPDDSRERLLASIRLGLLAVARIDMTSLYTNIAVKDFCNTILGAQLLDDPAYAARGRRKFDEWIGAHRFERYPGRVQQSDVLPRVNACAP